MSIKLSNSGISKYLTCGHSYKLRYKDRIVSVNKGSALYFGSAIDTALNFMLENKDNSEIENLVEATILEFDKVWEQQSDNEYKMIDLPLSPNIIYSKADYDPDLLEKSDWKEILQRDSKFFDTRNAVTDALKNGVDWNDINEDSRMIYNFSNWLCIKNKARFLIKAYHDDILPKIKKVLKVQYKIELMDEEANNLNGIIDFVIELPDGRAAIMDNKTTSVDYSPESVKTSAQLALYTKILNILAVDPEHEWNHKIEAAGYCVLSKKLEKDITKTCDQCGHVGEGSHKTCDNLVMGKRCNGSWTKDKKFKVNTQFIIDTISEEMQNDVLDTAVAVKSCVEMGLYPKNFNSCEGKYGRCEYFNRCHGGSDKGLIKLEEKK